MRFRFRLRKPDSEFVASARQKLALVKVYLVYVLIIGALYAGDTYLDVYREKTTAYMVAQNFVSQKLVAPSTAHFPPKSDDEVYIEHLGKNRYIVSGYLYSKNTFGNEKRSDYRCIVRNVGSGEWTPENIIFEWTPEDIIFD
ncbi:MAG: hypothetical protein P8Z37_00355 [Acidobacteriota bacterium]